MSGGRRRGRRTLLIIAPVVAAADLASKVWASAALAARDVDLPGPVDLRLGHNSGIAFSLFTDAPVALMVAIGVALVIVFGVAAWRGALPAVPAALILGGALGNVVDRIEGGSVVDLFHTGWWPTFNLADVFLSAGDRS